jgi:hypothetical protein
MMFFIAFCKQVWDRFMAPDFYKCRQIPYMCSQTAWPDLNWVPVRDAGGTVLDGASQQAGSSFVPVAPADMSAAANASQQITPG